MKKQILVGIFAVLLAGTAQAREKITPHRQRTEVAVERSAPASHTGHNMAGCGLGSMVIQDNSKWSQVGASILNSTGYQSFGISSGTSNCTEDGVATAAREKDAFVETNLADIRRDISVGSGEYLSSLASFYGCKGEKMDAFNRAMRKQQDKLNSAPEKASHVIDTIVREEHASCLQG